MRNSGVNRHFRRALATHTDAIATVRALHDIKASYPISEDEMMVKDALPAAVELRLVSLERELGWWRRAAGAAIVLLAAVGTMAFRQLAPGALEASSVTIRAPQGNAVTLSVRPSGDLEARFSGARGAGARSSTPYGDVDIGRPGASGLAFVNPAGREVLRIGDPAVRQLAP